MEEKKVSYRGKIRIILFLTVAIVVLLIFGTVQTVKAVRYKQEAQLTKQMALISLDEYLSNISTGLEKTIYASTPTMISKLSTELWRETSGAKNNLMILPTSDSAVDNTYKFLSQVGEFVMALGRKSAANEEITDKEREQLKKLYDYSNKLSEQVSKICYDMQNGEFYFEDYKTTLLDQKADVPTVIKSLDDVDQSLTDFPSLIYDGPFSEHLQNNAPKFLEGLEEITKNKALVIAGEVCKDEKASLKFAYEENGDIPSYVFQSENCTVAITKKGGKPLYMLNREFTGEIKIKYDEAVKNAKDFLRKIGYENTKETYYFTNDGICTINFASTQDDAIIYPDLIKVNVSLESGSVLSFDATGYISNHRTRNQAGSFISKEDAIKKINSKLTVIDSQKCVIPTAWGSEQYCYEVHCKTDNKQELLVYIDCLTGEEDNILILLYSDGGVLTK